ncbi:DNA topoisomerase 2 [Tanacetum coccineum]
MQMIRKTITFVPFLYQLFNDILVSAAADRKRVKDILVNINVVDNRISVWTHGQGVHDINFCLIRQAVRFGFVSVINGDGNELPTEEVVKSIGTDLKKVHITENWCLVSFIPHLPHFGMECLEHDIAALMKRRVVDLAGTSSALKVRLAGTRFLPRTFRDYVELYIHTFGGTPTYPTRIYEKLNDGWEICAATTDLYFKYCDDTQHGNFMALFLKFSFLSPGLVAKVESLDIDTSRDSKKEIVWICQISQEISLKRTRERMSDQEAKDLKAEAREIMPQPSTAWSLYWSWMAAETPRGFRAVGQLIG